MDKGDIIKSLQKQLALDSEAAEIVVVGLGKTGLSIARFLHRYDFRFVIVDSRDNPPLLSELAELLPEVVVHVGTFVKESFTGASHIIVSPGVSLTITEIQRAHENGARIVSDIDLFACAVQQPVVAITGSNGKSTVTTMLGEMATVVGKAVAVGGNLGIPALDLIKENIELYILELSSFQLERSTVLQATVATVLNVSPDHMDRHGDISVYANEKSRVFNGHGTMVINADDPIVYAMRKPARKTLTFGIKNSADVSVNIVDGIEWIVLDEQLLMPVADLAMHGRHNLENALAALALGKSIDLDVRVMCAVLREFKGLAHRMQWVAEIDGVAWINDSKATNIGACIAALNGYRQKVILIAGGDAKGADMQELAGVVRDKAKAVVLMGKDAGRIARELKECVPISLADNLQEAVETAASLAVAGESVLLSPACASLDQFSNYQERGNKFVEAVMGLAA